MKYKQYDIWLANLNPTLGTESGKTRTVVIIQTDLLNETHFSTIVCPVTFNVQPEAEILRVHLEKSQLPKLSDILVDQPRAIDNKRFIKKTWRIEQRAGHPTQGKPESSSGLISTIINKSIYNGAGV